MTIPPNLDTPDKTVAQRIITRLIAAGLLPEPLANQTQNQLASGTMRTEEWRLLAEKVLEAAARESKQEVH